MSFFSIISCTVLLNSYEYGREIRRPRTLFLLLLATAELAGKALSPYTLLCSFACSAAFFALVTICFNALRARYVGKVSPIRVVMMDVSALVILTCSLTGFLRMVKP